VIPAAVERKARWVLDTLGARDLGFGDDLPYRAASWERVERGVLSRVPDGLRRLLPAQRTASREG